MVLVSWSRESERGEKSVTQANGVNGPATRVTDHEGAVAQLECASCSCSKAQNERTYNKMMSITN